MTVKLLKILVAALALLVLGRLLAGPPEPKGLVVMTELEPWTLTKAAFEVDGPTRVLISATGTLDMREHASGLAAGAWILSAQSGNAVWDMHDAPLVAGRGALRHLAADTIVLDRGQYVAYFASYGQLLRHRGQHMRSDHKSWNFVVRTVEEDAPARTLGHVWVGEDAMGSHLVWEATRLGNDEHRDFLFEVVQPTTVTVAATGQMRRDLSDRPMDHSWIEDMISGHHVWAFNDAVTEPAGGHPQNRKATGRLHLTDGVYRAVAVTDRSHAYGRWRANPPWNPEAWGLVLATDDHSAIRPFDPWETRRPFLSITRVGDDQDIRHSFKVEQRVMVVICSMGEITQSGRYDFARLIQEQEDSREVVWSMDYSNSEHAGGVRKNRYAEAFMMLAPGTYTLEYQTDGSHAWETWNGDLPDFPERWGVSMFPVAPEWPPGAVARTEVPRPGVFGELIEGLLKRWMPPPDAPDAPPDAPDAPPGRHVGPMHSALSDGELLLDWRHLGGSVEKAQHYVVHEPMQLGIRALGEIGEGNTYDYGWIQRVGQREPIWEMTLDNTFPAGGGEENRMFVGLLRLEPGEYIIQFVTDRTHHYGDFDGGAPENPEEWGIAVWVKPEGL